MNRYTSPTRYTATQLRRFAIRDAIVDIRCARRDHCDANPLLEYADKVTRELQALLADRRSALAKVQL